MLINHCDVANTQSSAISDHSSIDGTGPSSSTTNSSDNILPHASFLSRLLADKVLRVKYPPKLPHPRGESRVLTSVENISHMKEKERKKEEAEEKLQKRIERERKRIAVQEEEERKKVAREQRYLEKGTVRHPHELQVH